jgi:hypothetical protein
VATTFDIYLEIQRQVDEQVLAALGRDTPNWRVLNSCPACGYEVCYLLYQYENLTRNVVYSSSTSHISSTGVCSVSMVTTR